MPAPETRTKRAAVIYNPVKVDLTRLRREVAKAEKAAGWLAGLWLPTAVDDSGTGQARQAIAERVDVVLVAGGGGTGRAGAGGPGGPGLPPAPPSVRTGHP